MVSSVFLSHATHHLLVSYRINYFESCEDGNQSRFGHNWKTAGKWKIRSVSTPKYSLTCRERISSYLWNWRFFKTIVYYIMWPGTNPGKCPWVGLFTSVYEKSSWCWNCCSKRPMSLNSCWTTAIGDIMPDWKSFQCTRWEPEVYWYYKHNYINDDSVIVCAY